MHRKPIHWILPSTLVVAIALIVAACSSGGGAYGAGGGTGSTGGGTAAGGATIAFATPADGADVTIPFDVQLDASVPLGQPESGNHHAHLYFDTGTDSGDYDIVYGTTSQVTRQLAPGRHTITVALANPDHSLAGPTAQITVNVTGGGSDAGSGAGSPAPANPAVASPAPTLGY